MNNLKDIKNMLIDIDKLAYNGLNDKQYIQVQRNIKSIEKTFKNNFLINLKK